MRYRTIVADPPWPMKWSGGSTTAGESSGSKRTYAKRGLPYATMTIDAIAALPVAEQAADDSHLFLWTLDRYVIDGSAAQVCRAWGFEPMPQMIVWHKTNAGLGRFIRPAHELILVGRRGDARMREVATVSVHPWRQLYEGGYKKHSAKPDGALDLVESLSDGPYLEMFSRRSRFGWDVWGDQALDAINLEPAS